MSVNIEAILIGLFSVAHTPAQAEHAAREVMRMHAHELAQQQRFHFGVAGAPIPAHCEPRCDFCRGVIAAADHIDPEVQQ